MSKEFTLDDLSQYDGIKRDKIYISVRGKVYDMTPGRDFYGPGAGYHVFAGKECSRALAKMSLSAEDCTDKLDDLDGKQLKVLDDWQKRFDEKYTFVGRLA